MAKALIGIKTCIPSILILVLLSDNEFSQYPVFGVRMAEARTSEVDASSLITECSNIWPRFPPPKYVQKLQRISLCACVNEVQYMQYPRISSNLGRTISLVKARLLKWQLYAIFPA